MNLQLSESDQVHLMRAILLYEARHGSQSFATLHEVITTDGGSPIIGAGQCLTRQAIEDVLAMLQKRPQRREILPPHVLYAGDSRLCWHVPSARRPIFFKTSNAKFNKELNGKEVLHPALIFLGRPGHLSVFAMPTNARPEAGATLFQAPYSNIYQDGSMCNGNVKLPDVLSVESIPQFERAFFETNFTHSNAQRLVKIDGGHDAFWRLQKSPYACMPGAETLLPLKLTLQEALDR